MNSGMNIELFMDINEPFLIKRDMIEISRKFRNGYFEPIDIEKTGKKMSLNGITNGDRIRITLDNGEQKQFDVFIGDALLKGNENTIWLKTEESGKNIYLRKLPEKPLTIGVALFDSKSELETTLSSGEFYFA
jgi:hypothetical protein